MLLTCDQPCSTSACTNNCYAESTAAAQGLFNALTNCISAHCTTPCADASASACSSCQTGAATGACVSELETCEQDTTVGPPNADGGAVVVGDAGGELNCGQYTSCVAACPAADAGSCASKCAAQATSEATTLASALDGCLGTYCPSTDGGACAKPGSGCNGCVEMVEFGGKCATPYQACVNDMSNSPDASTTPMTLVDGGTLSTVVTGTDQIGSAMIVNNGYLYFAQDNVSGQVSRLFIGDGGSAVDAGTPTPLGPPQPSPIGLVATSSDLYVWSYGSFSPNNSLNNDDGLVVQIPLDGGAPVTVGQHVQVYFSAPYLNAMTSDSQNLYWVQGASGNNGAIVKTPIGSTSGTQIFTGQSLPEAVATDGTNVYWANWGTFDAQGNSNNDGTIQKGSVNGGTAVTLAKNLAAPACIAIDTQNVYWTNLGKLGGDNLPALNSGSVMQVPIAGGSVITLASQESVPVGIAVAGNTVYWTEYGLGSPGLVVSAPKGGGTLVPLVANLRNPYSLVLSGNTMYWSNYAAAAPSSSAPLIESLRPF